MMCQVGIARQFWFVSKETRLLGFFLFHSTQCNLIYCGSHVESVYVPLATQPHMITGSLSWLLEKTFRECSMLPPDKEKRGACWSWLCSQVAGKSTLQINCCFKYSTHKLRFSYVWDGFWSGKGWGNSILTLPFADWNRPWDRKVWFTNKVYRPYIWTYPVMCRRSQQLFPRQPVGFILLLFLHICFHSVMSAGKI